MLKTITAAPVERDALGFWTHPDYFVPANGNEFAVEGERCQMPPCWFYSNDLDVRTMVSLGRAIGFDPKRDMPFDGERHNALADAIHQAKYVSAIYQRLVQTGGQNAK